MKVALITGGGDKPYALGLLSALVSKGIFVDFIGSNDMADAAIVKDKNVNFMNLRGDMDPTVSTFNKIMRVLRYYARLVKYAAMSDCSNFHILWFNKAILLDRIILNLYFKILGKKLTYTAHNIDEKERDGGNNYLNRITLKIAYNLVDHIFVHTAKMKLQLASEFGLPLEKVTIIPFGINNTIPKTKLNKSEARSILQLSDKDKVILFFGNIAPYKGVEYAASAIDILRREDESYRLIIAGQVKNCKPYWEKIETEIEKSNCVNYVLKHIKYIPDDQVEVFFKCSDVLVLPYKFIYQSGVLFLSYNFGLPVIASNVGSLSEDIIENETGLICKSEDSNDLSEKIRKYFNSDLYKNLKDKSQDIITYGANKYSWEIVANITSCVYIKILNCPDQRI